MSDKTLLTDAPAEEAEAAKVDETPTGDDQKKPDDVGIPKGEEKPEGEPGEETGKKTDDEPADAPDEAKAEESEGPPEKYDLGLSEDIQVPKELIGEFEDTARKLGLDNDQAKELAALMPRAQELSLNEWQETVNGWLDTSKEQFGEDSIARGGRFLREFGDQGLIDVLEQTGLGNHPALIGALDKAMKAMGEDDTPGKPPGQQGSSDSKLRDRFPSMFKDGNN